MKNITEGELKLVATTFHGLEEVLAGELQKLGARDIEQHNRSVSFTGDLGFIYKANFCLRTALRVLLPISTFNITDAESLYTSAKAIEWSDYFEVDQSFVIDCVMNSDLFANSMFPSLKIKDAIVDYFRDKEGRRPNIDKENPDIYIYAHLSREKCMLFMDTSGEPLFKRGYRQDVGQAPMSECLAAGLVLLSGWEPHKPLVDFMCGSGTILTEAALIAGNIPPGTFRERFAFQSWPGYDATLFETIKESAISRIKDMDGYIYGCDRNERVIEKAFTNITNANVDDMIKIRTCDFRDFTPPEQKGVIIINPPYGEKMFNDELAVLYKMIGDKLKKNYQGWTAWIISSYADTIKSIGLHTSRKITLYNGPLECKFLKYELYEGSKKLKKQVKADDGVQSSDEE